MSYHSKHTEKQSWLLERIKDYSKLVSGSNYHLRKMIEQKDNVINDEVHDIVLKEFKEGILITQENEEFAVSEFEIFFRKKI